VVVSKSIPITNVFGQADQNLEVEKSQCKKNQRVGPAQSELMLCQGSARPWEKAPHRLCLSGTGAAADFLLTIRLELGATMSAKPCRHFGTRHQQRGSRGEVAAVK